jgi:hypothetical protein
LAFEIGTGNVTERYFVVDLEQLSHAFF